MKQCRGPCVSGQALIHKADVSLAIVVADLAELKKFGWSDAKLWLRQVLPLAKNALKGDADLDSFLKMGDVSTVPALSRALLDKVGILERNA